MTFAEELAKNSRNHPSKVQAIATEAARWFRSDCESASKKGKFECSCLASGYGAYGSYDFCFKYEFCNSVIAALRKELENDAYRSLTIEREAQYKGRSFEGYAIRMKASW